MVLKISTLLYLTIHKSLKKFLRYVFKTSSGNQWETNTDRQTGRSVNERGVYQNKPHHIVWCNIKIRQKDNATS